MYFKADNCRCDFKSINKDEPILTTIYLKQVEQHLNNSEFFRCHKSYIINLNFVEKFNLCKGIIYLNKNNEIPLSGNKKEQFIKELNKFSKVVLDELGGSNPLLINKLIPIILSKNNFTSKYAFSHCYM